MSSKLRMPEILAVTVLGTGYSPVAPATVASAATCAIFWFIPAALRFPWALLLIPATYAGIWLSTRAIENFEVITNSRFQKLRRPNPHKEDPDQVVIDEFIGQWIALLAVPHNLLGFTAAFIAFRVLDIVKPFGIEATQKLKGGWGIMIDDVLAGIGSVILLLLASKLVTMLLP